MEEQMSIEDKFKLMLIANYFQKMTKEQKTDLMTYARRLAGADKPKKSIAERIQKRS